jgi:hypothetical protein
MAWVAETAQATDDPGGDWYVGTFLGSIVGSEETTRILLDCRSRRECAVELMTTSDPTTPASHRPDMGAPRSMSAEYANNELQGVNGYFGPT